MTDSTAKPSTPENKLLAQGDEEHRYASLSSSDDENEYEDEDNENDDDDEDDEDDEDDDDDREDPMDDDLAYQGDLEYLDRLEEQFAAGAPNYLRNIPGLVETLLNILVEDSGKPARALIHCQQMLKATLFANFSLFKRGAQQPGGDMRRLMHWHEHMQTKFDSWELALNMLLTHCPLTFINLPQESNPDEKGGLPSNPMTALLDEVEVYAKNAKYTVEAGTIPSRGDMDRWMSNDELVAIVKRHRYPQRIQADMMAMIASVNGPPTAGTPQNIAIAVLLKAKNMLPLRFNVFAKHTVGDLRTIFRSHRFIADGVKIDAYYQGIIRPDHYNTVQLGLVQGSTIEMRVHWGDKTAAAAVGESPNKKSKDHNEPATKTDEHSA